MRFLFLAFMVTTDNVAASRYQPSASAARDLLSPSSSHCHCYNHDEVDRFMAAMLTVENFAISCTSSSFGLSVNRKYISELVGVCLRYATAAVEQLTKNIVQYCVREPGRGLDLFCTDVIEESKRLLMSIVEHAAMLRECMQRGNPSEVSVTRKLRQSVVVL